MSHASVVYCHVTTLKGLGGPIKVDKVKNSKCDRYQFPSLAYIEVVEWRKAHSQ